MKLTCIRVGSGPRGTVLLHGFLGSGRNLWSLARAWSARDPSRTFLLMDLAGHGHSPPLPPHASLETMSADVLETAKAEGLRIPLNVVGHSLGGRVALAALGREADAIRKVVLLDIGPASIGPAGESGYTVAEIFAAAPAHFATRAEARASLSGQLSKAMVDWLLMNLTQEGDGFGWRVNRQALLDLRPAINATNLWEGVELRWRDIVCIRGALSEYVSDEEANRMESLGCKLVTIPNSGHFLHVDAPEALLTAILELLPVDDIDQVTAAIL